MPPVGSRLPFVLLEKKAHGRVLKSVTKLSFMAARRGDPATHKGEPVDACRWLDQ